jgi:cob(I)alamin adenosyltransferase
MARRTSRNPTSIFFWVHSSQGLVTGINELGKIHVITGPGKGKTTAAFGLAMRASGHGLRVCIIQFMKTGGTTGEAIAAKRLKNIEVVQFGTGKFVNPKRVTKADRAYARAAIAHLNRRVAGGGCDMLILDEVNVAVTFGLVKAEEILKILRSRKEGIEVVLTGRDAPKEFIECADYVSIIDSRKHPHSEGLSPREGVEW